MPNPRVDLPNLHHHRGIGVETLWRQKVRGLHRRLMTNYWTMGLGLIGEKHIAENKLTKLKLMTRPDHQNA